MILGKRIGGWRNKGDLRQMNGNRRKFYGNVGKSMKEAGRGRKNVRKKDPTNENRASHCGARFR
jgi:hypothetical protein